MYLECKRPEQKLRNSQPKTPTVAAGAVGAVLFGTPSLAAIGCWEPSFADILYPVRTSCADPERAELVLS